MRKLNLKQKEILNEYFKFNREECVKYFEILSPACGSLRLKLEEINDYENLWSDANRYIDDKVTLWKYGRKS